MHSCLLAILGESDFKKIVFVPLMTSINDENPCRRRRRLYSCETNQNILSNYFKSSAARIEANFTVVVHVFGEINYALNTFIDSNYCGT